MNKTKIININPDNVQVCLGQLVILVSNEYVGPTNCHARNGQVNWQLMDFARNPDGVRGNLSNKRRLTGWRGTTDDWACYAHGVWRVESVGESRQWEHKPDPKYNYPGERKARIALVKVDDACCDL